MVLTALRGALGFLSTLPVGQTQEGWEAFAARPAVMVAVGYVLGALLVVPLALPLPAPLVGFGFVLAVYLLAGINNVDGLLDVADGVATHGDPKRARAAMKDSDIGVGAVLTLAAVFVLSSGRKVLAHVDDHDPAPHSVDEALAVTVGD